MRRPDGSLEALNMVIDGNNATLALKPTEPGIHGIEVNVTAQTLDELAIDRAAFLTFEAQPTNVIITVNRLVALGGGLLFVLFIRAGVVRRRK